MLSVKMRKEKEKSEKRIIACLIITIVILAIIGIIASFGYLVEVVKSAVDYNNNQLQEYQITIER
jgi:Tfp pilus assembly protein PilE